MTIEEIIAGTDQCLMSTYGRIPIALECGEGVQVWDSDGREYLDFISGIGVLAAGHCHPEVVAAIREQAGRLMHCSNLYHIELQVELARALCRMGNMDRAFFCNSGAEANEAALKLARKHGSTRGAFGVVAMENSFHGRTLGTIGVTGQKKYQRGYGPLVPGMMFVPFNDLDAARRSISSGTCAVLVEAVQGEGGIRVADTKFLRGLRDLCDDTGALLICDEVQCGLGRTGRFFAYEHAEVAPDVVTVAKSLGGGFPIGAMLARGTAADVFQPGDHASTFGGNPLACAAALAFLRVLEQERLMERATRMGQVWRDHLEELAGHWPRVKEVRGRGLMVAMELDRGGAEVVAACRRRGLLINCTAGQTLRFLPPLVVSERELGQAATILAESMAEVGDGR